MIYERLMRKPATCLIVTALTFAVNAAWAEGHGPAFGLATPTLARGQWSSDTAVVQIGTEADDSFAIREMVGYGITEDLQALLTFPLRRSEESSSASTRGGSMMGAMDTVEASLQWRFHRTAPDVGTRYESAVLLGASVPTRKERGQMTAGNGVHLAAVTGYVSRVTYWWVGAGAQYFTEENGDQLGTQYYASAVFGYRPPLFQHDYPKPDWRVFVELLAESNERSRMNDRTMVNSGGEQVLVGPSVLGLYGRWGIEGGVLWPVMQSLNGTQSEERYRAKLVFTYWF